MQELRAQLAEAKQALRDFDRAYREQRRPLARAVEAADKRLTSAVAARAEARVAPGEKRVLDPHKQAGPGNVEKMRAAFASLGKGTAAAATRLAGSPVGHQVWAIRALEQEGFIRPTGELVNRSKVYEVVPKRERVTRIRPGESRAA